MCDRGLIAPRSDRDRGVLPRIVCTVGCALQVEWMVPITRHSGRQITITRMGEDRGDDRDHDAVRSMKIQCSSIVHVSQGMPLILIHLLSFLARVVITDRVDSGPRDLRRFDRIQRPISCHITCVIAWPLATWLRQYAPPAPRAGHPGSATWHQCRVAP